MKQKPKLTRFTISTKRWIHTRRDVYTYFSFLYRKEDDKLCCLGFAGLACGLSLSDMKGIPYYKIGTETGESQAITVPKALKGLFNRCSHNLFEDEEIAEIASRLEGDNTRNIQSLLAAINDDEFLSTIRKKSLIKKIFKKALNIDVTFVP